MKRSKFVQSAASLIAAAATLGTAEAAIFDGLDTRVEVDSMPATRKPLASAACLFVQSSLIVRPNGQFKFKSALYDLATEIRTRFNSSALRMDRIPFSTEKVLGFGSGCLVSSSWVLTAFHVIKKDNTSPIQPMSPDDYFIVVGIDNDFNLSSAIPSGRIFKANKLLRYSYLTDAVKSDWAVIQLGDPDGNAPVQASSEVATIPLNVHEAIPNTPIWSIGYPSGVPEKCATGEVVATRSTSFTCTLSSFARSSGSPILDDGNQLIGVVIKNPVSVPEGETDYYASDGYANLSSYSSSNPVIASLTSVIYDLQNTANFKVTLKVGSEDQSWWAGSSDEIGFGLDIEPTRFSKAPITAGDFDAGGTYLFEEVEAKGPHLFPDNLVIKKRISGYGIFSDDLLINKITLWSGGTTIQTWNDVGWLSRDNIQLRIDRRFCAGQLNCGPA